MKMKQMIFFFMIGFSAIALAKPEVTDVTVSLDSRGAICVSYVLSEPAVVLVDILTNGVTVGGAALANMKGDAGHLVAAGNRSATWKANKSGMPRINDETALVTAKVEAWSRYSPPDYLVVDLSKSSNFTYYASVDRIPGGVGALENKTTKMVFRKIPAAGQTMILGSGENEVPTDCHKAINDHTDPESSYMYACDQLSHPVGFTNDYYMAIYECTQGQWLQLFANEMKPWGDAGCHYTDCPDSSCRPVTSRRYVGLRGSVATGSEKGYKCNWPQDGHEVYSGSFVAGFRNRTGLLFDLPTVAQWEFAARAGIATVMPNGNAFISLSNVTDYAWCADNWAEDPMSVACNNTNQTHAVGQKLPNAWGLYDMLGNSSECCLDAMDKGAAYLDPLQGGYSIDYPGPESSEEEPRRARCGGRFNDAYDKMRFTRRALMAATLGGWDAAYRAWLPAESPAWQIGE